MDIKTILQKRVVYQIPRMEHSRVFQDIVYKEVDGEKLTADVYYPEHFANKSALPAVIFIHGDAAWEQLRSIKESGQYTSWGQLAAAIGFIGITFTHRSTEGFTNFSDPANDILDLFQYIQTHANELHIDRRQIGVWVCSAGGPTGLSALLRTKPEWAKCLVSYYALMDLSDVKGQLSEDHVNQFSAIKYLGENPHRLPPMYIVKAALDRPVFNDSIDRFVQEAERLGLPVQLITHSSGHHAFDLFDDNEMSTKIIEDTLTFLRSHLKPD